jgi:hypothetical protein
LGIIVPSPSCVFVLFVPSCFNSLRWIAPASCLRTELVSAALAERYFERREIREAIAFAEAGGIAVHRNFDSYDGRLSPRGVAMRKPFVHVIGLRPQLEEWGRRHGLRPEWIQPEKRRRVAHYDAFGSFAQALIDRLSAR